MIITHEKLGKIEVLESDAHTVVVAMDNNFIKSDLVVMAADKFVVKFRKKENGIPGFKVTKDQYLEIKGIMKNFEAKQEEVKYQKWLNENATYNCSYKFSSKANYSEKAIKKVRDLLVNDDSIEKITGFGDYNTTETYAIKNKDLIKMLDNAEKEVDSEVDSEIEEKIEIEKKIFAKAKATNTRQELKSYAVDCNDNSEACEIDTITKYALPNGFTETIRSHNW